MFTPAPCTSEPDLWFSDVAKETNKAVVICNSCPLRTACLEKSLNDREEHGTWGGTKETARRKLFTGSGDTICPGIACGQRNSFVPNGEKIEQGTRWPGYPIKCAYCGLSWIAPQNTLHRSVSRGTAQKVPVHALDHGTISAYSNHKCRCDECRAVWAAHNREYQRKRRERLLEAS